ncbi:hypothetical protein C0995_006622 [Termitomyces sp. Mi166|nr:hypothetical protein C0995_006622 [Termitomyces sp. Mi166\
MKCRRRTLVTSAENTVTDPVEYCKDLVQKHDYEGFLISHFYPEVSKGGYFALKAFSNGLSKRFGQVELAMVQEHVSNQTIGKMRMQFWRDTVKGIHEGKPPRHPIALALHQASQRVNLPAYYLKRIVDARDAELSTPTHMTTESLTAHAESTSSPLLYLLLSLLSLPSPALSHAASHLGTAQTFTTLLRALPYHAKQGHVIIPAEITAKHGVRQEDVLRYGPGAKGISDAVFEFATVANDHLITAREMLKEEGMGGKVPARAAPIFLAGSPSESAWPTSGTGAWLLSQPAYPTCGVMERLCDEVIQVIFYELPDPGPLTHVNKRFYRFSRDPYVRAHYFLAHYGAAEAIFHALGRGKVLDERVLDILLTSGAHLSRYLVQVSMHHYFHTASHFIKSPWVRTVPLGVFLHFLKLAEEMYGNIPRAKNEDDGYIFNAFLKQSRWPSSLKTVNWDTIREILEKYNDPLMVQFPLALAIEPRLLPYAVRNGFSMDRKYRDFVFRKMFERTASANDTASEEIVHNVRELCRLDHTMFVSRTVAAEVCMEAKVNVVGYHALKVLDKSGDLLFELADLVEDLIKTFVNTRSICYPATIEPLRLLYSDYPSSNLTVRLVMLVIFFNAIEINTCSGIIHTKLEALNLTPITRKDVFNVLLNPFISHPQLVIDYATLEMGHPEEERKGMSTQEVRKLVEDVISICLEASCKVPPSQGSLLGHLEFRYEFVKDLVNEFVPNYYISIEDLPPSDDFVACRKFEAKLSQDHTMFGILGGSKDAFSEHGYVTTDAEHCLQLVEPLGERSSEDMDVDNEGSVNLGNISQETLSTMIRLDEVMPVMRSRRRVSYHGVSSSEIARKLPYPSDTVPVGHWIKQTFGPRSRITAIFMTHAVVNNSNNILENYLSGFSSTMRRIYSQPSERVPVTLKHFKMLARLGKIPNHRLYTEIFKGCEFYFDEEDYIQEEDKVATNTPIKMETSSAAPPRVVASSSFSTGTGGRKRPRRTVTTIKSYAIPDSDDEGISDNDEMKKPKIQESNLQRWIFHLGELLKEEKRKHKEQKRKRNMLLEPGSKSRVYKVSDFYKSLSVNLRELRLKEETKRMALYGYTIPQNGGTDEDDDEYPQSTRTKRRKITRKL